MKHWNNSQLRMCSTASGCVISECSLIPVTVCPCVNKTRRWCLELPFPDALLRGSKPPEEARWGTGYIEYPSSPKPNGSMVDTGIRALCCIPISVFLEWEENAQSGSSDGTICEISASPSLDRPCEPTAKERAPRENDKPIGKQSDAWFKDGWWEGKRKKGRIREGRWIWSWEDLSTLWWPTARTAVKGRPSITRGVIQRKGCTVWLRFWNVFFPPLNFFKLLKP